MSDKPYTMNDPKIKVPEGMLKAAFNGAGKTVQGCPWQEIAAASVEAALLWMSENPIVPTTSQAEVVRDAVDKVMEHGKGRLLNGSMVSDGVIETCVEWQRRMFLAPEPEVPEEIKDLLWTVPTPDCGIYLVAKHNADVIESFRRSQKAGPK